MRQETRKVCSAFVRRKPARAARTHTNGTALYLFGKRIAWWEDDSSLRVTMCGWGTPTTRDRLNGVMDLLFDTRPFHQKKGEQYYNNDRIDPDAVLTFHLITPLPE